MGQKAAEVLLNNALNNSNTFTDSRGHTFGQLYR